MKSKFIRHQILTAFTMAILLPTIHAATTITYVGYQANVEAKINDTTSGWRNSDPAKPLDVDGDNILGTDGYSIFQGGFGQVASLPTYISNVTALASSSNASGGWGVMDDPSNPTGNDTVAFGMWFSSTNIAQFTVTGSIPASFRVGVLIGGYISGTETLTITQTVGGSASASQAGIAFDNSDGLEVAFFDITGASAGDTFILSAPAVTGGYQHASGLVFDSISIPEPRAAMLCVIGVLLLLLRRRRCA